MKGKVFKGSPNLYTLGFYSLVFVGVGDSDGQDPVQDREIPPAWKALVLELSQRNIENTWQQQDSEHNAPSRPRTADRNGMGSPTGNVGP